MDSKKEGEIMLEGSPLQEYCSKIDMKYFEKTYGWYYYELALEKVPTHYITNLLLEDFRWRASHQLNILASAEGEQGCGKSLFVINLCIHTGNFFGKPFVLERDIYSNPYELDNDIRNNEERRRTFMYDEQPQRMVGIGSYSTKISLKDYEEIGRYCVLGNTKIWVLENNVMIQKSAESLAGKSFVSLSFDFGKKEVVKDNAICVLDSVDLVTRITLLNGKTIEVNEEHPFFVKTNKGIKKVKTKDLKVGDCLFSKVGKCSFDNPQKNESSRKKLSNIFKEKWARGDFKNRKPPNKEEQLRRKNQVCTFNQNKRICKLREKTQFKKGHIPHLKGKTHTPEARLKLKKALTGRKLTKKHKHNIALAWRKPEYVKKQMIARKVTPNKSELKLNKILQKHFPKEYKFVGDAQFILAGKNPDFVNVNGQKKIIELFGEPFHSDIEATQRTKLFKKYGFSTLIIWANELGNQEILIKRIGGFNAE